MGTYGQGLWLSYSVLVIWCATVACAPIAPRLAPRRRVSYQNEVIKSTEEAGVTGYSVTQRAVSQTRGSADSAYETGTLPMEATSSSSFVSPTDEPVDSLNQTNSTSYDLSKIDPDFVEHEPADNESADSGNSEPDQENADSGNSESNPEIADSGNGDLVDNQKFACEDSFLRSILGLNDEDCFGLVKEGEKLSESEDEEALSEESDYEFYY